MTYAPAGRLYHDADSHIMEVTDWLETYADPGLRERLRPLDVGSGGGKMAAKAVAKAEQRRGDQEAARALEDKLMTAKGWGALGAFDPGERTRALDLLGFHKQLVFPTFAPTQFAGDDLDLLYGGGRALNRGLAEFCADDDRLLAVASVSLEDPERASVEIDEAVAMGCRAIMIPSAPPKERSPSHPVYDQVWARLQDHDVPFMLHIGGGGRTLKPAFHNNDRPVTDHLGGGENLRSKDFMAVHVPPELFLSVLVLDGIFEKFPGLRGGVIEHGALWVVPWLMRLDVAQDSFKRTEKYLDLPERASTYARRALWFTPFPTEPVGWMVEQGGDDLFLFSSDYPHPEGGRDPLKRFNASLQGCPDEALDRFYSSNFAEMMGGALTS